MKNKTLPTLLILCLLLLVGAMLGCREPQPGTPAAMLTPPSIAEGESAAATAIPGGYPGAQPGATATPAPYLPPGSATPLPLETVTGQLYIPALEVARATATPSPSPTPSPAPTNTPVPTPTPTIDFQAVRESLRANNQELAFVKIGLHVGPGGNPTGLGEWMRRLDAAGVPFFLKSADYPGPMAEAQEIVRNSDVDHILVYRATGTGIDHPEYELPPVEAARRHWQKHKALFPAELDPNIVWYETINEVDKNRAEWLGQFAVETARLALADGYKWAAFGWATGEPEPHQWQTPSMLEYLRLAGANPDRLAVALHEYSLDPDIGKDYPYLLGRFLELFRIADAHGIPRPTVLITEWGWEANSVPGVADAMRDIAWASRMYAHYPQIKGAGLWYLGPGFGNIADQAQPLIGPLTEYALGNYFAIPPTAERMPLDPGMFPPPN